MSKPNDLCKDNKATVMLIKAQSINWKISPCLHMKMSWICREGCWSNNLFYILLPLVQGGTLDFKWQRWSWKWGQNSKPPKNPYGFKQYLKKSHAEYPSHKNFQRNYAARIYENYHESPYCFEWPKKSLLKSRYPKRFLPKFPHQRNPKIEDFNPPPPPKSFNHPCHLKSRVAPWECLDQVQSTWVVGCLKQALKILQLCLVYRSSRMLNCSLRLIFTILKTL